MNFLRGLIHTAVFFLIYLSLCIFLKKNFYKLDWYVVSSSPFNNFALITSLEESKSCLYPFRDRSTGDKHINLFNTNFTWHGSFIRSEDPREWWNLQAFILGWTNRGNYGKSTELVRRLKKYKNYFNTISLYRILSVATSHPWW